MLAKGIAIITKEIIAYGQIGEINFPLSEFLAKQYQIQTKWVDFPSLNQILGIHQHN